MKQKKYGGTLGRYQKRNEMLRKLACFGLFMIGFMVIGSLFGDVATGIAYAAAPFGFILKDGVTDPIEIKKLEDAYIEENGGEAGLAIKESVHNYNKGQLELKELIASKADSTKIKALEDSLVEMKDGLVKQVGTLNDILMKQGLAIKEMKEKGSKEPQVKHMTMSEAIMAAFVEKKAEIDTIVKNGGKGTLQIKVAVTMGETNTIGSGSTQVTITEDTGIISVIRTRELTYRAHVSTGTIGTSRALWIEETDEQGTPIFIAEAAAKTQLSVLYVEKTATVKKIGVYGKITTELMADLPQLVSYIQNNLMRRLDIVVENKLLFATGAGDDPLGMESYATTFTGGALAGTIIAPNELDVIEAIALQSKVAFGQPNTLFIHPSTLSKIKLIKDAADRPLWKDYITIDGKLRISGMDIIETTAMTAGNFLGGDTSVVNLLIREELGIQIGLDGSDFTTNKKTMLVEKRLVQFVSANDTAVLIKGDFTTAIALLQIV